MERRKENRKKIERSGESVESIRRAKGQCGKESKKDRRKKLR